MWAVLRQVRKHPDSAWDFPLHDPCTHGRRRVVPVFVITALGATFACVATVRACVHYTDVSFRRKSNPHPWVHIKPFQQTKFIVSNDYKEVETKRPNYTD